MPSLLLIRHAQASYGADDYDVLSELGHRQVQRTHASLTLRGIRADRLTSGALRRQRDTAEAFEGDPRIDPRWDEYDAADLLTAHSASTARMEGGEVSSHDFQPILDEAMLEWIAAGDGGAAQETWPMFRDRVDGALEQALGELGRGQTGMVFTSGGVIAAVVVSVLGIDPRAVPLLNRTSVNASVTKLISGGRGVSLVSFNEHAHLEPDLVSFR
jgi:broad specificity phosphatase PhoE